ncbi:hypothetical protein, conserved [Eimeria maxima]|uniref:Uncharacterized protein n=1 Tax=Eimeria maxima TaxID=5804 RepID=U6M3V5_EIMMA|nr:hypothetical protein, conserved [Eimeria maxima]CDJ58912.1 hypothetical protein, conserved [Eimeria maxima]
MPILEFVQYMSGSAYKCCIFIDHRTLNLQYCLKSSPCFSLGAIRFEAAADSDEEEYASSDFGSDDDIEGSSSESDAFSFSGSDSEAEESEDEIEEEEEKAAKAAWKGKKKEESIVDLEDLHPPSVLQKKRKAANEKERKDVPVSTLRRQAAKRKHARVNIEYEPEAMTEEA